MVSRRLSSLSALVRKKRERKLRRSARDVGIGPATYRVNPREVQKQLKATYGH
jgi:hypothetical protein